MTPAETKQVYEAACNMRRLKPQQEEASEWHKALKSFELKDVRTAMSAWWASTDRDDRGELRSKWLPTIAELKGKVDAARAKRVNALLEPQDIVRFECNGGHRCCGFIAHSAPDPSGRHCHCGSELTVSGRVAL